VPITEKQRARRKKHLGSSDMAAILGVDPYLSAYDVWLEKTGRIDGPEENEVMAMGKASEPMILKFAEAELGDILRNQRRVLDGTPLAASIDGIVKSDQLPVEAKTSGLLGPLFGQWGEFGTDEVPDSYIVQCHVHMVCMKNKPELCYMTTLLGGRGFGIYTIRRNKDLCEVIIDTACKFWSKNVQANTPPDDSRPSLELIRKARRTPDKVALLPLYLFCKWQKAKEVANAFKKRSEELQAAILAADPEAEAFDYGDPEKILTFYQSDRKGYTIGPSTVRTLRIVKRPVGLLTNEKGTKE